jgi:hypothetical protein
MITGTILCYSALILIIKYERKAAEKVSIAIIEINKSDSGEIRNGCAFSS